MLNFKIFSLICCFLASITLTAQKAGIIVVTALIPAFNLRKRNIKKMTNVVLSMIVLCMSGQLVLAQHTREDTLRRIMFDINTLPEQRRLARNELLQIGEFAPKSVEHPTDSFLRESALWFKETAVKRDLLVDNLIDIVQSDPPEENVRRQEAIRLLAKAGTPKANAFLVTNMDIHVWPAYAADDKDFLLEKATHYYILKEAGGSWAFFPLIMKYLSTRILDTHDLEVLPGMLLQIVEDSFFLVALLNLYEAKADSKIFTENKRNIVDELERRH